MQTNFFSRTQFNNVLIEYNPATQSWKEVHKTRTGFRLADYFIKIFRYLFNSNSRLSNVVRGLERTSEKIKSLQPGEIQNYINYVNIFKKQVVEKHNQRLFFFQNPIHTESLERALARLSKQIEPKIEKPSENDREELPKIEKASLSKNTKTIEPKIEKPSENDRKELPKSEKVGSKTEELDLSEENLFTHAKLAHEKKLENLRLKCDAFWDIGKLIHSKNSNDLKELQRLESLLEQAKTYELTQTISLIENRIKTFKEMCNQLSFVSEADYEHMYELASKYDLVKLKQICKDTFKRIQMAYKEKKWKEVFQDHPFPPEKKPAVFTKFDELQWTAVKNNPESENKFFEETLKLNYPEACRLIYYKIIQLTVASFIPSNSTYIEEQWGKNNNSSDRLRIIMQHSSTMHKLFPEDRIFLLLDSLKTICNKDEVKLVEVFTYSLCYYLFYETGLSDSYGIPQLPPNHTAKYLLDIFKKQLEIGKLLKDESYLNFVQRNFISPTLIFKKVKEEANLLGEEAKKQLLQTTRENLYALISPDYAVGWGRHPQGQWEGVKHRDTYNSEANLYLEFEAFFRKAVEKTQFNHKDTSNVVCILPDKKELSLHKDILASQSTYFESELKKDPKPMDLKSILKPEEQKAFVLLMQYLYTNEIKIDDEVAPYILDLAERFGVKVKLPLYLEWCEWLHTTLFLSSHPHLDAIMKSAHQINLRSVYPIIFSAALKNIAQLTKFFEEHGHLMTSLPQVDKAQLAFICKNCPNIEEVHWPKAVAFDANYAKELAKLKNLRILSFESRSSIDMGAIQELKECTKLHKIIGYYCTFLDSQKMGLPAFQIGLKGNFPHLENQTKVTTTLHMEGTQMTGSINLQQKQPLSRNRDIEWL